MIQKLQARPRTGGKPVAFTLDTLATNQIYPRPHPQPQPYHQHQHQCHPRSSRHLADHYHPEGALVMLLNPAARMQNQQTDNILACMLLTFRMDKG